MDKKTDQRIVKTYSKLTSALKEIMTEKDFDELTVFDLCEKAQIRRATFYKHFKDKHHFLVFVVQNILDQITESVNKQYDLTQPVEYFMLYAEHVINFVEERNELLNNILNSSSYPVVFNAVTESINSITAKNLKGALDCNSVNTKNDIKINASFINGGIATTFTIWLREKNCSREELIESIRRLLIKILY